jgi:hypothetical protein
LSETTAIHGAAIRKKESCHLGYFWVYNDPITGSAVFKYQQGRGAKYPEAVLKNFNGYLQTDGYSGYDNLVKSENIIQHACWAHARRKFEEALPNDKTKAEIAMKLIQELYDIERQAKEAKLNADQRKALRKEKSLPVYNLIGRWISQNLKKTLLKSVICKVMQYTFDRWDELGNYMLDGLLEIHRAANRNNLVENAIRPVANRSQKLPIRRHTRICSKEHHHVHIYERLQKTQSKSRSLAQLCLRKNSVSKHS